MSSNNGGSSLGPTGVCVKVNSLRAMGYTDLEAWVKTPGNVLVTRRGRVFIGSGESRRVFCYPGSPWANPFKLKDYTLQDSLYQYEGFLDQQLQNENVLADFSKLRSAKQLGCFCAPGSPCHRDIILKKLDAV